MSDQVSDDHLIHDVAATMRAEADACFPDERLARQQAKILQRIEQEGRPGRVIVFPAGHASAPALRTAPVARWIAAAAAVAFLIGLLAGQRLPHEFQTPKARIAAAGPTATAGTTLRASAPLPSDAEFLGEVEAAADSRPAVLQHLDALTPRAWEVKVGQ